VRPAWAAGGRQAPGAAGDGSARAERGGAGRQRQRRQTAKNQRGNMECCGDDGGAAGR
jgi:hypothetical protein